ncbi:threonine-phosphate decarboxylase [Alphaproteobacteria bacterium KMM 3653]|uniref:threonine-phosphate decarboxylase n=1 Tax=Harenicola maris TaxID=2841044 RepID=A0AAP2G6W3_9RHOB|nr:threonine-phosphate decarboxylase [Harenicola maris]
MRDHGGNMDNAMAKYGGGPWIDLSTGINRVPYPVEGLDPDVWTSLPTQTAMNALLAAARAAYETQAPIVALSGAQAAIQLMPRLAPPGRAAILGPTYNEHAAALAAEGWEVSQVAELSDLQGADMAVVVNPNNPVGQHHAPQDLLNLLPNVGRLVVDESFADPVPEFSLAPRAGQDGLIILRSFGKFYGLAGLRLGFALGSAQDIEALRTMAGPWAVNGPALAVAAQALNDAEWADTTRTRLIMDAARMDEIAVQAGWSLVGGTTLFRTYSTPHAAAIQTHLAKAAIWSRIFPYSEHWVRLGLPGNAAEWAVLETALTGTGE